MERLTANPTPLPLDAAARAELARKAEKLIGGALGTMERVIRDSFDAGNDWTPELDAQVQAAHDALAALLASVRGAEAEVERLRGVLKDIAFAPMDVAPDMEAETFYRLTAGDCVRTAARALNPRAARAHPPTQETDA